MSESITLQNSQAKPGQYLTFNLLAQPYAIPIGTVREINRVGDITPLPKTPDYVAGVMNLRGKVIPVVDLRIRFGMAAAPYDRQTCIIVIDGVPSQFGIIVNSVTGVVNLAAEQIEPAPTMGSETSGYMIGMAKVQTEVIILLNVVQVLAKESDHLT